MKNSVSSLILYFLKSHVRRYGFVLAAVLSIFLAADSSYASTTNDNADVLKGSVYRMSQNITRLKDDQKLSMTGWKDEIIEFAEKHPDNIILNANKTEKVVALTFDDGPDSSITSQVIDTLVKYEATATFFFVGSQIEIYADVVKKAHKYGFQIAGHSYTHPHLTELSDEDVLSEINKTANLIKENLDVQPMYIRPPYGDIDDRTLKLLGDLKIILWSIDTVDWASGCTASEIADYVIENIQPGDIVLMHSSSSGRETLKAVPLIVEGLRAKGYSFCTVAEMIGTSAYINES